MFTATLSGPFAQKSGPTFSQLCTFAWGETDFVFWIVVFAFFLLGTLFTFLLLEWAGRATPAKSFE